MLHKIMIVKENIIKDFYWSEQREPHFDRRKIILQKHPEVKKLIGHDIRLVYATLFLVVFQIVTAYYIDKIYALNFGTLYFIQRSVIRICFLVFFENVMFGNKMTCNGVKAARNKIRKY